MPGKNVLGSFERLNMRLASVQRYAMEAEMGWPYG